MKIFLLVLFIAAPSLHFFTKEIGMTCVMVTTNGITTCHPIKSINHKSEEAEISQQTIYG